MKDCPEIKDLAHFIETAEGSRELQAHVARCDACQEARANLEDEARSLQISISEIWFREQISCPDAETLERFRKRTLDAEEQDYVAFHLETLDCPTCQGRQSEAELVQSPEGRGRASKSRRRVADATIKLLGDMKKKPDRPDRPHPNVR
jgi:hypothetical protein